MRKRCDCCGYFTVAEKYDICPVCFWENDPDQSACPDCAGGSNGVCLVEAKRNYKMFGACEERFVTMVRSPHEHELGIGNEE